LANNKDNFEANSCYPVPQDGQERMGEKNKVDLDFDAKQKNDCEGKASATNSVVCKALVDQDMGEINITQ